MGQIGVNFVDIGGNGAIMGKIGKYWGNNGENREILGQIGINWDGIGANGGIMGIIGKY